MTVIAVNVKNRTNVTFARSISVKEKARNAQLAKAYSANIVLKSGLTVTTVKTRFVEFS